MRKITFALSAVALSATSLVAHPGHDHGDIPSLIRHPFASPEHMIGTAIFAGLIVGAVVVFAIPRREPRQGRSSSK